MEPTTESAAIALSASLLITASVLPTVSEIAKMMDHSLLRLEHTTRDVREGCALTAR
jgi:hypothetical protein